MAHDFWVEFDAYLRSVVSFFVHYDLKFKLIDFDSIIYFDISKNLYYKIKC